MTRFDTERKGLQDDQYLSLLRRDLSGGQNTRQHGLLILENQAERLLNWDISIPGQRMVRLGSVRTADVQDSGVDVVELKNFEIQGATDQLLRVADGNLRKWTGSGNWSSAIRTGIVGTDVSITVGKESGLSPDDIFIIQDGTTNAFRYDSSGNPQDLGNTNTSPPITTVGAWYRNRFWFLKNDALYFSDAYDDDYSGAFDRTTNIFRIPVGEERCIAPIRDSGMVIGGSQSIWAFNPSATPTASDKPEPLLTSYGVVSKKGWVVYGDDFYFFSNDGFRSLKRTQLDKLQVGVSYPLSYTLKDDFDTIDWSRITTLSMNAFDNKIDISVPVTGNTYQVWTYYPATNAMTVNSGTSPLCWANYKVSGEEQCFYGRDGGNVYRWRNGFTDEGTNTTDGTAINAIEIGRKEDFGQSLVKKDGGSIEIRAKSAGDVDIDVYAQFDDDGYNLLGSLNLTGNFITFPVTFPVSFGVSTLPTAKYHFRNYGKWRFAQFKLEITDAATAEIVVVETSATAFVEQYQEE